jgi:hypothetical protein
MIFLTKEAKMQTLTSEPLFLRDGVEVKDGDKVILHSVDNDGNVSFFEKRIIGFDFDFRSWPRNLVDIYLILENDQELFPEEVFVNEGDLISHLANQFSISFKTSCGLIKATVKHRKEKLEEIKKQEQAIKNKFKMRFEFLEGRKAKFHNALINVNRMGGV